MKVKITDPKSKYFGQEFDGGCAYCDVYHTGDSPDLYIVKTPDGDKRFLSTQIDVDYYKAQRLVEEIERLGAKVGDRVIITRSGSGCSKADFKIDESHVITDIDYMGYVDFDNGAAKNFRPDVKVVSV